MVKYRGQMIIVELIIFFIALMIGLMFLTPLGTTVEETMSNTTLFPANSAVALMTRMVPFLFIVIIVLAGIIALNRRQAPAV